MLRKILFAENEFYHLYNRGVEKRTIFLDDRDYSRFMRLLLLCNTEDAIVTDKLKNLSFEELALKFKDAKRLISIGAYCLMPNHFHVLAKEIVSGGISRFMKKLLTAYSMYFNKRYAREGALFDGRFKSSHIKGDSYLQHVLSYIHLNPIRNIDPTWRDDGIRDVEHAHDYLEAYPYSSYADFLGTARPEGVLIERRDGVFPESFKAYTTFFDFLETWLSHGEGGVAPAVFEGKEPDAPALGEVPRIAPVPVVY